MLFFLLETNVGLWLEPDSDACVCVCSPFLLLIFVLEELFELLRVLHVGAAVRLWVKRTQPRPPADLQVHVREHV